MSSPAPSTIRATSRRGAVFTGFGHKNAGPCSVPGAMKGDAIVYVTNASTGANATSNFESTVTVAGQIQQSSTSDFSANEFDFYIQS